MVSSARRAPIRVKPKAEGDPVTRVLDAAADCFKRYGVHRTRMEDIAELAGLARPNLYRYFPNKESLVLDVIVRETRVTHRKRLEQLQIRGPIAPLLVQAMVLGFEFAKNDELL